MTTTFSSSHPLATRRPFVAAVSGWEGTLCQESYVLSRELYKSDLIETISGKIHLGPVLECSGGYGSIGTLLATEHRCPVHTVASCSHTLRLCRERASRSLLSDCRYSVITTIPDRSAFEVAYSLNSLHEWPSPQAVLRQMYDCLLPGGALIIDDLRRDADPFIMEYVIRELAADQELVEQHHLDIFLTSLASAYSAEEFTFLFENLPFDEFWIDDKQPMTMTATVRKHG